MTKTQRSFEFSEWGNKQINHRCLLLSTESSTITGAKNIIEFETVNANGRDQRWNQSQAPELPRLQKNTERFLFAKELRRVGGSRP